MRQRIAKRAAIGLGVTMALALSGCGGGLSLYYRGTSAEGSRVAPVTADGSCALESGEVLDLGPILKVEGPVSEVVVTRKF